MGNRPKLKGQQSVTLEPGPGSSEGCPCCATMGLPRMQPGVPSDVVLQCCEPCIAALALDQLHPHAVPHLHWHERPGPGGYQPGELCPVDGLVTQTCVVDDHRVEADVDLGHSATHDSLVEGLGGLRASGIWWTHHTGADALTRVDQLWPPDEDLEPRVAEVRRLTLEHLENEHALLIVAWCVAADPALAAT